MTPTEVHGHDADALHNPDVAHEESDVNIRAIISFAVIVAAVSIVCAVIVWGMFVLFEHQAQARDPQLTRVARPATVMPAHTNEPAALKQERTAEDATLHQYGWVDQKAGVAHIPIDQAKKLLIERGLPARTGGTPDAQGSNAPAFGESNGGRTIPTGEAPAGGAQGPQQKPAAGAPDQKPEPAAAPAPRGGGE
jgi:hypothetical protein